MSTASESADLSAGYRPGSSFFFRSPTRTLLTQGVWADLSVRPDEPDTVRAALGAATGPTRPRPIAVGAIPFRAEDPARLSIPASVRWSSPVVPGTADNPDMTPRVAVQQVPDPAEYERAVEKALARLAEGGLGKVVLARTLHLAADQVDVAQLLRNLTAGDPHGRVFAVAVPGEDGLCTMLGASPELLVSRFGRDVVSHPLAGSAARSPDPVEDRRRASALLESAKDRAEHAFVVDAVAAALLPYCDRLLVPAQPALVQTATMWHLGTRVTGTLADPETTALTLAAALHPTPAVCGTPVNAARELIAELEPFPRGYYGGAVGWCDAAGDGEWAVTIRCAEVSGNRARLFAGAGIVPGSQPAAELAETTAKFRTLLRALGLDDLDLDLDGTER